MHIEQLIHIHSQSVHATVDVAAPESTAIYCTVHLSGISSTIIDFFLVQRTVTCSIACKHKSHNFFCSALAWDLL